MPAQGKRNNESYFYDTTRREWKIPEIAGTPPHPRSHHTANLVEFDEEDDGDAEKKIFIIGGCEPMPPRALESCPLTPCTHGPRRNIPSAHAVQSRNMPST